MKHLKFIAGFIFVLSICLTNSFVLVNAAEFSSSTAKSIYLMDYDTNTVILKENESKRLPIASMTKIMLLDLVFESIDNNIITYEKQVNVSENASGMGGSQVFLQANKNYKLVDLVKSVVIASANDASVALAEEIAGSEAAFVNKMNQKAKDLGLTNTLFSNCTGLPKPTQYSCAKDVAIMLKSLLRHEDYYKFSKIWLDEIVHPDGSKTTLTNTNKLSRFYDGCDGGKTGFTNEAGFCLAATAKRDNMRLIGVVIGYKTSASRFKQVSEMFNSGFQSYESKVIVDSGKPFGEPIYIKGAYEEQKEVYPRHNLNIFTEKNAQIKYSVKSYINGGLKAPISKGEKVGEVILYKDGVEYAKTDLIINSDVQKMTYWESLEKIIEG